MSSPVNLNVQTSATREVVKTCLSAVTNTAAMPFSSQYARPLSALQTLSEKRVLLAEDNDLNAEIVLTVLEENGIHAEHVKDGALCLKAVQNAPEDYYNVILMDIQMPNMNGYQAAEAIRALPGKRGEIPIVAMTANAFEEDRRKALESGMNAHIAKPVDVSVLLETLSRFS